MNSKDKPLVYFVAGVPASGKSFIVKTLISKMMESAVEFKYGKLRGITKNGVHILGVYDGGLFDGTDRLPMDVIDDAIEYIKSIPSDHAVVVEGDRLFCKRFLDETCAKVIIIDASPKTLKERHDRRGDTQPSVFLKRTRTKVENIVKTYGLSRFMNEEKQDAERLVAYIQNQIKSWTDGKVL